MPIEIKPYTNRMIDAVIAFNKRIIKGGSVFKFPESNVPSWLPKNKNRTIYQEYFLALENKSVVRGGYVLKQQDFFLAGDILTVGVPQLPISEGIIDRRYNMVGLQLLTHSLGRQPILYALGVGGYENPIHKIHKALGWYTFTVPFYFKVNHPYHFFRQIVYLRKTTLKKLLLDLLALTGVGWLIIKIMRFFLMWGKSEHNSVSTEVVSNFSNWADELWNKCKNKYFMVAVRNSNILNILYPSDNQRFIRLKVSINECVVGWAVVLDTRMFNHKQFGNMRVGSIIDCLALPENATTVVLSATEYLKNAGVDLIVSNQSHESWCAGLKESGFMKGPSNFIFAASEKLTTKLKPIEINKSKIHMNRGDCDGPINL